MKSLLLHYRQKTWVNIFVIYLRYLVGGAFVFSAIPKILGERFTTDNCETTPIDTWMHFFETLYRSGIYWEFLGWVQLFAGLILMIQLYSTISALIFFPVILNVFVITVSYHMTGTIVVTGLMLLASIFLLIWESHKIIIFFLPEQPNKLIIESRYHHRYNNVLWAWLGLILFLSTIFCTIYFNRNPTPWFLICVIEGLAGLIIISRKTNKITG